MLAGGLDVALVVSDRPCRGLEVAASAGVEHVLVDRRDFGGFGANFQRDAYSAVLADELSHQQIDVIAMAGFGTVLTAPLHEAFPGRVLNTHPSLLPDFKGWHAVPQALAAGVAETGCTVHVATEALDDGPILAQERVAILADDTEATLHERIKNVERTLYPAVVAAVVRAMADGHEPASLALTGDTN